MIIATSVLMEDPVALASRPLQPLLQLQPSGPPRLQQQPKIVSFLTGSFALPIVNVSRSVAALSTPTIASSSVLLEVLHVVDQLQLCQQLHLQRMLTSVVPPGLPCLAVTLALVELTLTAPADNIVMPHLDTATPLQQQL